MAHFDEVDIAPSRTCLCWACRFILSQDLPQEGAASKFTGGPSPLVFLCCTLVVPVLRQDQASSAACSGSKFEEISQPGPTHWGPGRTCACRGPVFKALLSCPIDIYKCAGESAHLGSAFLLKPLWLWLST